MSSSATIAPQTAPPEPASPAPAVPAEARWSPRLWGALVVLCGVLFLDGLDLSMVGVALPEIQTDLSLSTATLQWVVSGYILGYGGLLLLGGRAADLLGRRRVLLVALAVFAVASLIGGLVDDGNLLIAARFVKGVSAAFTAPASLSIITTTFKEGPSRNRALSVYTTCGASGFSLGLIVGGLMTTVGWRWTFLLPVPIALAVLAAGLRFIPREKTARTAGHGYDLGGAITSTAALLLLVFTVVSAPDAGWLSPRTVGSLLAVVALAAAFVVIELRVAQPLVRLGILRDGSLVSANLGAMAVFGAYGSFQFVAALYFQRVLGWSPLQMALALLPTGLLVATSGPWAGKVINRWGAPRAVLLGLLAFVPAYALFLRVDGASGYTAVILPSVILLGLGFALAFPGLNVQATSGVADEEQGLASGLVQTSFQIGGAVVLAVVSAIVSSGAQPAPGRVPDSFYPALVVITAVTAAALLAALARQLRRP